MDIVQLSGSKYLMEFEMTTSKHAALALY